MPDFLNALQNGVPNLWIFIPSAILLGALHGLEPGHSKTMMAAFIIAIRGTVAQAVLLGLSAAISHSLIIWILAAGALYFGHEWNAETSEPYLQIGSAFLILALAIWMLLRTSSDIRKAKEHAHSHEGHDHSHAHHHEESFVVDTGHEKLVLSVFEDGVPPVFRIHAMAGQKLPLVTNIKLETVRADGVTQLFQFEAHNGFLQSKEKIPEPHEFKAIVTVHYGNHPHTCLIEFQEGHHHHDTASEEYQDAHERAHAEDIARRFVGRKVTTPEIVLFGITGGLMPCPAAFSILLMCLQLKRFTIGITMVAAFSIGLALTMVAVGTIAAMSVKQASKRLRGFGEIARRAPYFSCVLLVILAVYMAWHGWTLLQHGK